MENSLQMLEMLFVGGRVHSDVVKINHDDFFPFIEKNDVYGPLENVSNVHQVE